MAQPPPWLNKRTPRDSGSIQGLDAGETEAIFLAQELGIKALLLDERKARHVAAARGFTPIGTLAILEIASSRGWADFDECVRRLSATTFRVHERLMAEARLRLQDKQP